MTHRVLKKQKLGDELWVIIINNDVQRELKGKVFMDDMSGL